MTNLGTPLAIVEATIAGENMIARGQRIIAWYMQSEGVRRGRASVRQALADELRSQGHARAADQQQEIAHRILRGEQ